MGVLQRPGQDRPPTTRKRRLWSLAPGPQLPVQFFEGYEILSEIPTSTGLALFEWLRAVHLWLSAVPDDTTALFWPLPNESALSSWGLSTVEPPLDTVAPVFAALLAGRGVTADRVVDACVSLSEWAREMGDVVTAVLFIEAAAWIAPDNPDLAFRAGRSNRHRVAYDRGVLWFQRGIGQARRSGNWTAYIDCWLGWGNLEIARGNLDAARRHLVRAYRAARKHNLRSGGAAAAHDLFMLNVDERRFVEAYTYAAEALALYPPDHPSTPFLIHDLAQTWSLDGYAGVALSILKAIRQLINAPSAQVQIAGNLAEAAGLAGDVDVFYEAWDEVSILASRPIPYAAAALASVAEGAYALRLNRQATEAATEAVRMAQQRQEATEERRARDLLDRIRKAEPPPMQRDPPESVRELAARLLARVNERTEH